MIKAIIFDLGKVLIHFDFKRGYKALEELCPYPAAEIRRRMEELRRRRADAPPSAGEAEDG